MIYEHEIPRGSRLYFGDEARIKRKIEDIASKILYKNGFEEIVTPFFSYHQHQSLADEKKLIALYDEENRKLTLRADSTIDSVRLITKRVGKSLLHNKWFYVQSVFRYPTKEFYQVGAEYLKENSCKEVLKIAIDIIKKLEIKPYLQICNAGICEILIKEMGFEKEKLRNLDIEYLLKKGGWIEKLLEVSSAEDAQRSLQFLPFAIKKQMEKLIEQAKSISYDKIIIEPLYYADMLYYNGLFFRFIDGNSTVLKGGEYKVAEINGSGFCLYTDAIIKLIETKGKKWLI